MKRLILGVALALAFNAPAAVYLKADAPDGGNGTSWSTAYKTLGDALVALNADESGDPTLYIAKGVYYTGKMTTHALTRDARMLGGYKGETDGDMTRDSEEYQSIISGISSPETKTWTRAIPVPGGFSYTTAATTEKIVVDGKLSLPAPLGEFDAYFASSSGSYFLRVSAECAIVVDGIKFICFNREGSPGGSAIGVNNNAKQAEISNCVFAGGDGLQRSMLWIGTTTEESSVKNCKFYYNRANYSNNPHAIFSGTVTIEDCEFVGAVRGGGAPTDGAINGGKLVKNCLFSHNMTPSSVSASGCPLISLGSGTLEGCKIVNNFCADKLAGSYFNGALIRLSTGKVKDCLVANNRCEFYVLDGKAYSMLGRYSDTSGGAYTIQYENCLIASNVVAATSIGMTSGSYAISVMGSGSTARTFTDRIKNCVLDGNIVSNVVVEGVTPTLCRGVLGFRLGASQTMTVDNCTFMGPAVDGVSDIETYGSASTSAKSIFNNCVFMCDGSGVHAEAVRVSQANSIVLKDCTIKNMLPDFYPANVDVTDGLCIDEIPFERVPFLFDGEDTGYGWLRPAAKTPGIRETTDGSVRGAVNALSETAENGATLTIRREPFAGGSVDVPVQAVAKGAAIAPVRAVPVAGGSFGGWLAEDGSTYSTENPLTIASLDDDLVLTASFATRNTTITFDLNGAGTFVDNGASRIECELSAGETFPSVPAFTVGDNNHIYRWDEMPTVVPNEDVTYSAHWVTKDLRIVYVTKDGAGAKDGSGWANAYDDISAAYADAGRYRGEVWIGEGVYTQALPIVKRAAVNVRGGFAGGESSAAQADPAAHPTVVSGGGTTFYFLTDTDGVAGDVEITGLLFTDFYRSAIDFSTADVGKVTVSKCRFENCNLGGTASYAAAWVLGEPTFSDCFFSNCVRAIYAKSTIATTTVVERCLFVANRDAGVHVAAANDGRMVVRNCEFRDGVMTTANAYSSGCQLDVKEKRASATISDCTFARNQNRDQARGCVGFYGNGSNAGDFIVERCAFRDNVCQHSSWNNTDGYFTSQQFGTCVSLEAQGTTTLVRDCSFVGNVVTNFGGCGASCIVSRSSASKAVAVNCTFEANVAIARENLDRKGTWRSVGNAGTINAAASGIGLVNCTFVANTNRADTGGTVADVFARASTPTYVLNGVLWNDAPDYAPFARTDGGRLTVGRTVAKNYDETVPTAVMGFVKTDDPHLADASEVGPNGVLARELRPSTGARGGYPVWTSGAQVFVRNPGAAPEEEWLNVSTQAFVPADGLPDLELLPDAWGRPRRRSSSDCGSLNAQRRGLMLFFQ